MKILVVSQHFFPDNFRINEVASYLVSIGHEVTVLTSTPDYATGYIPEEYKNKFIDEYNGVKVLRVKTAERKSGIINRAKNYISFMMNSTKKIKELQNNFDVILSYQTSPVLMAHAAIKAKKYFPVVCGSALSAIALVVIWGSKVYVKMSRVFCFIFFLQHS